jgi:hypothetical protein
MSALLGTSIGVFIGLTVIIAGGAAIMAGRALADGWKPVWQVIVACFGLGLGDRFLIYALFDGPLLSLSGFLVHFVVITAMALIAYRITRVHKMVSQYPWRYERVSLWAWREKTP